MKKIIQLEEVALFAAGLYGLWLQPVELSWWAWILLFLLPDAGMAGYLVNTSVGAVTYNVLHHRLIAVAVTAMGHFTANPSLLLAGLILFTHSSFDRALGYGLKYSDHFRHTHLGRIGKGSMER